MEMFNQPKADIRQTDDIQELVLFTTSLYVIALWRSSFMLMVLRCEPHVATGYGPCIYMDSPKSMARGKDEMGDLTVERNTVLLF